MAADDGVATEADRGFEGDLRALAEDAGCESAAVGAIFSFSFSAAAVAEAAEVVVDAAVVCCCCCFFFAFEFGVLFEVCLTSASGSFAFFLLDAFVAGLGGGCFELAPTFALAAAEAAGVAAVEVEAVEAEEGVDLALLREAKDAATTDAMVGVGECMWMPEEEEDEDCFCCCMGKGEVRRKESFAFDPPAPAAVFAATADFAAAESFTRNMPQDGQSVIWTVPS